MAPLLSRRHLDFVLYEVLRAEDQTRLEAFAMHDRQVFDGIIDAAQKLAIECFLPSHRRVDDHEPRMENGHVVLPAETAAALEELRRSGFFGAVQGAEHGGLQLPRSIANAAFLWLQAANVSIANYAFLTMSAAELLSHHATSAQQHRWMLPMVEGRYFGTMALSEPQAGSSLGDIRTSARLRPDGRYSIRGTKMWISGGEHDMGENIVHLMLARIEGAPAGVKGISLFIVPRRRLDDVGRPAIWNNVVLAGLNHKLGQRGTVNTVLNVGEGGETIGEIVGGPGQGLACMFTMMNEARIAVSMGAVAHASAAYQHALEYARDRMQGRAPDAKDPSSPQVPIIAHADVQRMLMQQKAAAEGGVALGLYVAKLADEKAAADDARSREEAALLLDFLTPVFKAWISEEMLTANFNAIQVLGGAGYTRDHPVELHYRDNRLNPIHEGTNGIQAIDLLGRKALMQDGRARTLFLDRVHATAAASPRAANAHALRAAAAELEDVTTRLVALRKLAGAQAFLTHAHDYMEMVGAIAFAWIWLEQANAAARALAGDTDGASADFYKGQIAACRWVFVNVLPRAAAARCRIDHNLTSATEFNPGWLVSD